MSVINFLSFEFSRKQRKTKLALSQNLCATPIHTFLQKIEQISDILLISLKNGWSDLTEFI